ncbi:hypothetical protein FT663_01233 [Candidozyma haemuli var. vulneris]|uniref:TauD/TfdA-like domain-containing protein n=1 Tax=Candidozyma haemuli TaxID=45357 RepID=A0A2V1AXN4_9ASCO|nr:hypothetical protein CXQ85_005100 [[Candida] haemuloni]KAF3992248.1 hypothetical protein FT662_01265 [[Candida] haemuloni var. vulneris]KAF3994655.1 hypothetical protein FT663_01233 [[Candida] haemuloni var. vulneris]PVH22529.1 hypothetical protein CXQ85_005100 [[Candida] haemuloni]
MAPAFKVFFSELDNDKHYEELKERIQAGKISDSKEVETERDSLLYPEYLVAASPAESNKYNNQKNVDGAKNDKGHLGDPEFKTLFNKPHKKFDLSPNLGTEIEGIQLSELDDQGKNDLALFLETRGLAIFRDQDFRDKGPEFAVNFGKYFGPLHIHPVAYSTENHPELFVTFRKAGGPARYDEAFKYTTGSYAWHSDVSFEEYPSSFSFFVALEAPESGGDTLFLDGREAYRRLSPQMQKFLEGLTAIHSNYGQNRFAALRGQVARIKADYFTEHPLVRTHPVTGEKSLFFSRIFIQKIKGLKASESDAILNFLEDHVTNNPEFQVRAAHKGTDSRSVILWDNRILMHSHCNDFLQHHTSARHHFRITCIGEKPYLDNAEENGEDERPKAY